MRRTLADNSGAQKHPESLMRSKVLEQVIVKITTLELVETQRPG